MSSTQKRNQRRNLLYESEIYQILLFVVLHLGCKALLGLGLYVSKALDAEPADLDRPDDTAKQIFFLKRKEKKEQHTHANTILEEEQSILLKQQILKACVRSHFLSSHKGQQCVSFL